MVAGLRIHTEKALTPVEPSRLRACGSLLANTYCWEDRVCYLPGILVHLLFAFP